MADNDTVAQVIRERLAVMQAIDASAVLSFLESAAFRLELFDIVKRFEDGTVRELETLAALDGLHQRVSAVIASSSR